MKLPTAIFVPPIGAAHAVFSAPLTSIVTVDTLTSGRYEGSGTWTNTFFTQSPSLRIAPRLSAAIATPAEAVALTPVLSCQVSIGQIAA